MKGIKLTLLILLLTLSFKGLASSNLDTIPPIKYHPVQIDSFVCFPIYEAGSILDSLKGCEGLYLYTLELEKEQVFCNDMVFGLRDELQLKDSKILNLQQQNNLLNTSLDVFQQKEVIYRDNILEQSNVIGQQKKQIKRAKTGKNVAWTITGIFGSALIYFVVKSI